MDRRTFLRRAAVLTAGVVAADQLELLERLAPHRFWPGADFGLLRASRVPPGYQFGIDERCMRKFALTNAIGQITEGNRRENATITLTWL